MSDDLDVVRLQDLEKRVASLEDSGTVKAATEVRRLQRAIEAGLIAYGTGYGYGGRLPYPMETRIERGMQAYRNEMKQTGTYTAPGEKG